MARRHTEGGYLLEDGALQLPQEDYFKLAEVIVDGLQDIADGGDFPRILLKANAKTGVVRFEVISDRKKLARTYKCLVPKDGRFVRL